MNSADAFEKLWGTSDPEPEKLLAELLPTLRWLCLDAVPSPTVAQLQLVRTFAPYSTLNLLETRRALMSGMVRLGPLVEDLARSHGERLLTPAGLQWRLVTPTREELRTEGLCEE
jgi:hypothetical protein